MILIELLLAKEPLQIGLLKPNSCIELDLLKFVEKLTFYKGSILSGLTREIGVGKMVRSNPAFSVAETCDARLAGMTI